MLQTHQLCQIVMLFIQVYPNENEAELANEIATAYVSIYNIQPPQFTFGRGITQFYIRDHRRDD